MFLHIFCHFLPRSQFEPKMLPVFHSLFFTSLYAPVLLVTTRGSLNHSLGSASHTPYMATMPQMRKREEMKLLEKAGQSRVIAIAPATLTKWVIFVPISESWPKDLYGKQLPMAYSLNVTVERNEFPFYRGSNPSLGINDSLISCGQVSLSNRGAANLNYFKLKLISLASLEISPIKIWFFSFVHG